MGYDKSVIFDNQVCNYLMQMVSVSKFSTVAFLFNWHEKINESTVSFIVALLTFGPS